MRGLAGNRQADANRPLMGLPLVLLFGACAIGILGLYSAESLPLLALGMLPTIGAAFAGRKERGVWISVGWLNFAGLSYWLLDLWSSDHSMSYATAQLRTVVPILVAYAAAALGWFIHLAMPVVAGAVIAANLRRRKTGLAGKQRKLVEQWDSGIASPVPVRSVQVKEARAPAM